MSGALSYLTFASVSSDDATEYESAPFESKAHILFFRAIFKLCNMNSKDAEQI